MNTSNPRPTSIESLGYSAEEATFLALVAGQSGYFVARQFDAAIQVKHGKRTTALLDKLVSRGHVRRHIFEHNRHVYHLQYKPFYQAIGDPDSRNRREHQPQTIKARLMAFDYVLANPDNTWLDSEQQKIAFLKDRHGIAPEVMPSKRYGRDASASVSRRFVDRFPISHRHTSGDSPDRLTFTWIDSGFETMSAFTTYLRQYKPLFEALREFDLAYVGTDRSQYSEAEHTFQRVLSHDAGRPISAHDIDRLLVYFHDRDLFERGESKILSRERMDLLRDAWDEFGSQFYEGLFGRWKREGELAVRTDLQIRMACNGRFQRYVLPFDYDCFGSIELPSRSLELANAR
jgi:hypothetical protein